MKIRMSSRYTATFPLAIRSLSRWFIMDWKVAGEFVKPKNMTVGSNSPRFVLKAAFHSSPSLIRTLLNPQRTSSLVNYLAPLSLSMISPMSRRGY